MVKRKYHLIKVSQWLTGECEPDIKKKKSNASPPPLIYYFIIILNQYCCCSWHLFLKLCHFHEFSCLSHEIKTQIPTKEGKKRAFQVTRLPPNVKPLQLVGYYCLHNNWKLKPNHNHCAEKVQLILTWQNI